jgi:hypothetical protein
VVSDPSVLVWDTNTGGTPIGLWFLAWRSRRFGLHLAHDLRQR